MGSLNSRGWEAVPYLVLDLLRYLAWALMGGLIAVGTCWYGGYAAYHAWQKTGPPSRRRRAAGRIAREAARGIIEIEAYLAARATSRRHTPRTGPRPGSFPAQTEPHRENRHHRENRYHRENRHRES